MFNYNDADATAKVAKKLMTEANRYRGDINSSEWGAEEERAWASYCDATGVVYSSFPDYHIQPDEFRERFDAASEGMESRSIGYSKEPDLVGMYSEQDPDAKSGKSNPDEVNWSVMPGVGRGYAEVSVSDNDDAMAEGAKEQTEPSIPEPVKLEADVRYHPPGENTELTKPPEPAVTGQPNPDTINAFKTPEIPADSSNERPSPTDDPSIFKTR
jgi:hypothetical protein